MTTKPQETLDTTGAHYRDFTVTKVKPIPEIGCVLTELRHTPTAARVLHLGNDDPENLFCLSFKTLPDSSNGVAHILEHAVLCGSDKYPVKDPFFSMTHRSLNTFMNALTGQDFTCYPAASQISKDFYNLLEVYLDAVFHPKLERLSFLQEGHRLELEEPTDPSSALLYKGVVYNEMKGGMSTPNGRLFETLNEALYPDITYGVNSGGNPKDIPNLTYEELKLFHETYYHPSRCLFFFYGNFPLVGHLDFIEEKCLRNATPTDPIPPIQPQKRFTKPKAVRAPYPFAATEDASRATIVAIGWLTCQVLQQQELLALSVLQTALTCTDASPLVHALLTTKRCQHASGFLDEDNSEVPFVLLMRGCDSEATEPLLQAVTEELERLAEEGVPEEDLQSAIHQLEIQRSEIVGDHYPYGLMLYMRCAPLAQHGGEPEDGLMIHTLFSQLRKQWADDPSYFQKLIRKYLLQNPHRVAITLEPDPKLESRESEEERAVLAAIRATLSDEEVHSIITTSEALEQFQEAQKQQDLDVLPKVTLQDVPSQSRDYPLQVMKRRDATIYHHNCFTNDLLYADWYCDLRQVTEQELPAAKLLTLLLPNIGNGGRTWEASLQTLQAYTGGIHTAMEFDLRAEDPTHLLGSMNLAGKALARNSEQLFSLLADVIQTPDFSDRERIKELLQRHYTGLQSSLAQRAVRYAMVEATAHLGVPQRIGQLRNGLSYFHWVRKIVENLEERFEPLIAQLEDLHQRLYASSEPHLILSCSDEQLQRIEEADFYGLLNISSKKGELWTPQISKQKGTPQGRIIPAPVAYCCIAVRTVGYTHADAAALSIASNLFDTKVLHPEIREKGGAYGAHATSNPLSGIFSFYTYRDPNIASSYRAFLDAINLVSKETFSDDDLEEAKLEVVQGLDNPISPGSRADTAYSWLQQGKTLEVRQAFRQKLLAATKEEVSRAVAEHLEPYIRSATPVVFGGKELLEAENPKLIDVGFPKLELLPA